MVDTTNTCVASLAGATKRYGKQVALHGLDLQVRRGELLALLGPNGAGKSTAISLLLGLTRADDGEVQLFGANPQDIAARRRIGVMLQSAVLQGSLRVGELLALAGSYYPAPLDVAAAAGLAGIDDLLRRPYAALSGGQQRRVQFAIAVTGRPELLFLDEPTVGMDLQARQALWATVRALVAGGTAVVLTTHYLEEAEALADRVVVMTHGRVVSEGTVDELRARVSRKHVRCITSAAVETVAQWPGVDSARSEQGRLVVTTADAEGVVRRLLAGDAGLAELEVQRAGLAEAFTELTRDDEPAQEAA
jgi:ABC-2 type transport system ATP-binding protein